MIEFWVGFASCALVCCLWHVADRAERRSVPAPELDEAPIAGEKWVLRGIADAGAVTVYTVCAGSVFFAYEGTGTRSLSTRNFIRFYRRV